VSPQREWDPGGGGDQTNDRPRMYSTISVARRVNGRADHSPASLPKWPDRPDGVSAPWTCLGMPQTPRRSRRDFHWGHHTQARHEDSSVSVRFAVSAQLERPAYLHRTRMRRSCSTNQRLRAGQNASHGVYFGWLRRSADPRFDRHREGRMEQQRQTCSKRGFHGQSSRPMGQDGVGSTNVGVGLEKFERVYRRPRLYRLGCGSDLEGFSLAVD